MNEFVSALRQQSSILTGLSLLLVTGVTAALNGGYQQPATVMNAAGDRLTGGGYTMETSLGETAAPPSTMTGGGYVMTPGFLAKKKSDQVTGVPQTPPAITSMSALYPNPMRSLTTVRFTVSEPTRARVQVYDVQGRVVRTLLDSAVEAGEHESTWDGRSNSGVRSASGVYFVRLEAGSFRENRRVVLTQ